MVELFLIKGNNINSMKIVKYDGIKQKGHKNI